MGHVIFIAEVHPLMVCLYLELKCRGFKGILEAVMIGIAYLPDLNQTAVERLM